VARADFINRLVDEIYGPSSGAATARTLGFGAAGQATPKSFQFMIALNTRAKLPCVSQRQNGRIANSTT
jgi:hypothetical protein